VDTGRHFQTARAHCRLTSVKSRIVHREIDPKRIQVSIPRRPKRVLVIAYHFPPAGGAGVQRSLKFARYLPSFGYEPIVVTGPLGSYGDFGLPDESLERELSPGLEIYRVEGPEPGESDGWRGRRERWLRRTGAWSHWWTQGALEATKAVGEVDVVFTSMSPFESTSVAAASAAQRGVPWVADLRDPWALDEMQVYPTRVHRHLEMRRMRSELGSAAAVVMNTPEAASQLGRSFPELKNRVVSIPNGFDAADFEAPIAPASPDRFRIVHMGELHTELAGRLGKLRRLRRLLGGHLNGVDVSTRSHLFLLDALGELIEEEPGLASTIELHLVGPLSESDRDAIAYPNVHAHGYLAHREALACIRTADLLFLPMHDVAPGSRARIVPGKTYEYIASGRPILAAVPEGDARDLLASLGNVTICPPSAADCMARAIKGRLDEAAPPDTPPPADFSESFERRSLTERLSKVLDSVTQR
jgi:glycosyl transferase family 1